MSDSDLLAEFAGAVTKAAAKVNEVEEETADALADTARTGFKLLARLFEN